MIKLVESFIFQLLTLPSELFPQLGHVLLVTNFNAVAPWPSVLLAHPTSLSVDLEHVQFFANHLAVLAGVVCGGAAPTRHAVLPGSRLVSWVANIKV
jgi:hypothetical protein